jgi:predicted nucleotidyltransferase
VAGSAEAAQGAVVEVLADSVEVTRVVEARAEAGKRIMNLEKQLEDFVAQLRRSAGDNLESVVLYGSAASGKFHPELSNINLLCILRETTFSALSALAPAIKTWLDEKHPPPMLLTREELQRSVDVFAIEFLDIKEHHKVLFGSSLPNLEIPMDRHRAQVEYELREKLVLLRQRLLVVLTDDKQLWSLLMHSLPAFTTLFRHALIALGDPPPKSKAETLRDLAKRFPIDSTTFTQLLDLREHPENRKGIDVKDLMAGYLETIQQVTAAVDKILTDPRRTS